MNAEQKKIIEEIKNVLIEANNFPVEKRKGAIIILSFYELKYLVNLIFKLIKY